MTRNNDRQGGLASRALRLFEAARKAASRPTVRPWLLLVSAATFLAIAYLSFRSLPQGGKSASPLLVLPMVLLAAPITLLLNASEYRTMASALRHEISLRSAAKVSLTATLANYLPAPGGLAVRTAALKVKGSSMGSAVSINAVAGVMWLGVAGLAAGLALMATTPLVVRGALAASGGAIALGGSALWIRRGDAQWGRTFGRLLWIEAAIVVVAGLRIWMALQAIGEGASIGAAVAISSSAVIAAAVGIAPAGLGLREIIGGTLAVAVEVPVAAAMAAMAVDRVAGQVGMGLCAPLVGLRRRSQQQPDQQEPSLYNITDPAETAGQK